MGISSSASSQDSWNLLTFRMEMSISRCRSAKWCSVMLTSLAELDVAAEGEALVSGVSALVRCQVLAHEHSLLSLGVGGWIPADQRVRAV
mmetsp:Transcript_25078/g.46017  ORF Transcript_25078/g.46017 Transcript_25078/m.46017 type:complete len:90 (-) Transcript_25078:118-387(-)